MTETKSLSIVELKEYPDKPQLAFVENYIAVAGNYILAGKNIEEQRQRAFNWLIKSAEENDADAQYCLALFTKKE